MKTELKKAAGRPKKAPRAGSMVQLAMRVPAALKERLDNAADRAMRLQSHEATRRLEKSFEWQPIIDLVSAIEDATGALWRDDPLTCELAILVISSYFRALGPQAERSAKTGKRLDMDPIIRWSETVVADLKSGNL